MRLSRRKATTPNRPRIRRMAARDAAAAARLSSQLGYPCGAPAMRRRIRALTGRSGSALFVAESPAGTLCGWAHVESRYVLETGAFAELMGLVVDEGTRGRGFGRALVTAAEGWARARGHRALRLRSNVRRRGARAFYERLGYVVVKRQNVFMRGLTNAGRGGRVPLGEGNPASAAPASRPVPPRSPRGSRAGAPRRRARAGPAPRRDGVR